MPPPPTVILFDLDGTLVKFDVDAPILDRVLAQVVGLPDQGRLYDGVGRTERWIATEAARSVGMPLEGAFERYAAAYTPLLREALAHVAPTPLPGVTAALEALRARDDVVIGMATGGMRANAVLKMEHARIASFFDPLRGAFGDEHHDRVEVFRHAALDCGWSGGQGLVFVGDTERDILSALEVGGRPVGVATGGFTEAQLREAGAAAVLPDFTDLPRTLSALIEA
ncbi:MAG: haloacid dehalogenase-like hydrolase [Dehalococcoidia bacterium]|nr:haloacid dehalogenase-like hydrolase [Dehalococcoidia bacterium]